MKLNAALLLMTLPLCAQDYKIAIIGMVHGHVWGHLQPMLTGSDARLAGIAETNPELIAEAKKRGATCRPDLRRLQEDARRGEARHRLVLRGEQSSSGNCGSLRAAQDSCDL